MPASPPSQLQEERELNELIALEETIQEEELKRDRDRYDIEMDRIVAQYEREQRLCTAAYCQPRRVMPRENMACKWCWRNVIMAQKEN